MKYGVSICTDSVSITDGQIVEARSSMEALLAALHHETSAYKHLKDMPHARLHIKVEPMVPQGMGGLLAPRNIIPFTLNQEIGGIR